MPRTAPTSPAPYAAHATYGAGDGRIGGTERGTGRDVARRRPGRRVRASAVGTGSSRPWAGPEPPGGTGRVRCAVQRDVAYATSRATWAFVATSRQCRATPQDENARGEAAGRRATRRRERRLAPLDRRRRDATQAVRDVA
ncbi:predicted protein [Streptomyces sp. SPB78]|nr:predicted protein [Streptomyces sp. SPB78]